MYQQLHVLYTSWVHADGPDVQTAYQALEDFAARNGCPHRGENPQVIGWVRNRLHA